MCWCINDKYPTASLLCNAHFTGPFSILRWPDLSSIDAYGLENGKKGSYIVDSSRKFPGISRLGRFDIANDSHFGRSGINDLIESWRLNPKTFSRGGFITVAYFSRCRMGSTWLRLSDPRSSKIASLFSVPVAATNMYWHWSIRPGSYSTPSKVLTLLLATRQDPIHEILEI